jgi:hypothetical protein
LVIDANLADVEVFIDDQRYGLASPGKSLRVPGLASGQHTVRGVRMGYEPVFVDVNVIPGGEQTVSLRLLHSADCQAFGQVALRSGYCHLAAIGGIAFRLA